MSKHEAMEMPTLTPGDPRRATASEPIFRVFATSFEVR